MRLFTPDELLSGTSGDIILLYSETGVGKSVTCLQTARMPILHFMTESRDPSKFLIAADRPDLRKKGNLRFGFYESWDDTLSFFSDPKNTAPAKTIIVDSITFLSNIQLMNELTDETFEALKPEDREGKQLIKQTKMSMEAWGGLSGQLKRFTNIVSKLSQEGKTIIFLALLEENPKFDRSLSAGPALSGKDFPKVLPGFCDFIGMLEPNIKENGRIVYPPRVRFISDGTFMAKWTGLSNEMVPGQPDRFNLNIERLLAVAHGEVGAKTEKKGGKTEEGQPRTRVEQLDLPLGQ
jgi:hypothetical protein